MSQISPAGAVPPAPPILAIETSCDDTAAAVWAEGRLASSVVAGQRVHEAFGGVVPEAVGAAVERDWNDDRRPVGDALGGEPKVQNSDASRSS